MTCKKDALIVKSKQYKKHGKYRGIQRYICTNCGKTFSSNRRPSRLQEAIFYDYFKNRYTLSQLSKKYSHSRQWIQEKIHTFIPNINQREGYKVTVVIDATFFEKGYNKFGLIVAKDINNKEPIAYNFIQTEIKDVYNTPRKTNNLKKSLILQIPN